MSRSALARGFAMLEATVMLAVLLPIAMLGVSIVSRMIDFNALRVIPEAILRESLVQGVRWVPGGTSFAFDQRALDAAIVGMSETAVAEAQAAVFTTEKISSRACYWVYSVNTSNGSLESPIQFSRCESRGTRGGELDLEVYREREVTQWAGGTPLSDGQFVGLVVLLGVAVGGDPIDPFPFGQPTIQVGSVSFPRQEVTL